MNLDVGLVQEAYKMNIEMSQCLYLFMLLEALR